MEAVVVDVVVFVDFWDWRIFWLRGFLFWELLVGRLLEEDLCPPVSKS